MRPWIAALWNMPLSRPHGVALVLIYPCGKAQNSPPGAALKAPLLQSLLPPPPFPLALDDSGSVLAVKGTLRRFAPWTAPGRSERMAVYEGKGGFGPWGAEGESLSPLAHDKGYYHSCLTRPSA